VVEAAVAGTNMLAYGAADAWYCWCVVLLACGTASLILQLAPRKSSYTPETKKRGKTIKGL